MSKKTWFLAVLAAGLLARAFSRGRAPRRALPGGTPLLPGEVAADSPNAAERLQRSHAQGAWAGIGAGLPGGGAGATLFPTAPAGRSAQGDEDTPDRPMTPGLPEFFRGA